MHSIHEANTEIKGRCEAAETGARASFPGVRQPAPSAPPPAPKIPPHAKSTARAALSADSPAPLTSGSSPARGVRRRAVAAAGAAPRSPARQGASLPPSLPRRDRLPAARATICGQPRQKGHPPDESGASRARGAEGRGGPGRARAGRTGEKALPDPPLSPSGGFRRILTSSVAAAGLGRFRPARCGGGPREAPGPAVFPHRGDGAAEESRCLLPYVASDSCRRFSQVLLVKNIPLIIIMKNALAFIILT